MHNCLNFVTGISDFGSRYIVFVKEYKIYAYFYDFVWIYRFLIHYFYAIVKISGAKGVVLVKIYRLLGI